MNAPVLANFDFAKLWDAMEAKRKQKNFTERQMMDDLNVVNNQAHLSPISLATLKGIMERNTTTCQHALHMCRWVNKTLESFLEGKEESEPLPFSSEGRLYWSMPKLADALKTYKDQRGISWKELAQELDCSPGQLSGLHKATYGINIHLAMRITQLIGRKSVDFIRVI